MDKPKFVYVTYILTTPETLWNALMDGEMTKQYWGRAKNVSDWKGLRLNLAAPGLRLAEKILLEMKCRWVDRL